MSNNRNETNFLRALAIILVINSHMDSIYPIKMLATGGMIGNSLFFMLSSYGLFTSWMVKKKDSQSFGAWYGRRVARIYPSVWLIIILLFIPYAIHEGLLSANQILDKMEVFFFPPFWFLRALLIYYVMMYFILKHYSSKVLFIIFSIGCILYALFYLYYLELSSFSIETIPFSLIFYFLIILWGFYLASIKERIIFNGITDIVMLLLSISCVYVHKYLMTKGLLASLQIIQHIAVFPMLFYLLKIAKSNKIASDLMNSRFLGVLLKFISVITLELFITNNTIIQVFSNTQMMFPWNGIAFVILCIVSSIIIYNGSKFIRNRMFSEMLLK